MVLATLRAQEGLVASMDKVVLPEVAELQEGFPTLPTAVPALDHLLLGWGFWWGIWDVRMTLTQR